MTAAIGPGFAYLAPLQEAVDGIANSWRPDDQEYRADVYRQIVALRARQLPTDTSSISPRELRQRGIGRRRAKRW